MGLRVKRFLTSVNASNCYLCWDQESREGVIVDPSEFTSEMKTTIADLEINIVGIFVTHGHYDHNSAVSQVVDQYAVPVYAAGNYPGGTPVEGDDVIEVGNSAFLVASTPGHTEDSITFLSEGVAFVGDALFAAAVGGTSSRPYFEREVKGVAENVFSLPDCTTLFPGHGPSTTVAVERIFNPFFL